MSGTKFNLNFNLGNYYYGDLQGYKGFDFSEVFYFSSEGINAYYANEHTGFNNDLHGSGEAVTTAIANYYHGHGAGYIMSPTSETFTLKSGEFASAWDTSQNVYFISFKGSQEKASVEITLTQSVTRLNFANYGSDFKNITKLEIYSTWKGHVSSVYGAGYQIVMDNIKGQWNGSKPHTHGARHYAHVIQPLLGMVHGTTVALAGGGHDTSVGLGRAHVAFHSILTSLNTALGHSGGGLTAEFSFSGSDHFGT